MWRPGAAVLLTATDTAQQLTTTTGLVKAIRFQQHWNNSHNIYWGDATLSPTASPVPLGVKGWLPPPSSSVPAPFEVVIEPDAPNGQNANQFYVAGTTGEIILWSYLEQ